MAQLALVVTHIWKVIVLVEPQVLNPRPRGVVWHATLVKNELHRFFFCPAHKKRLIGQQLSKEAPTGPNINS